MHLQHTLDHFSAISNRSVSIAICNYQNEVVATVSKDHGFEKLVMRLIARNFVKKKRKYVMNELYKNSLIRAVGDDSFIKFEGRRFEVVTSDRDREHLIDNESGSVIAIEKGPSVFVLAILFDKPSFKELAVKTAYHLAKFLSN